VVDLSFPNLLGMQKYLSNKNTRSTAAGVFNKRIVSVSLLR